MRFQRSDLLLLTLLFIGALTSSGNVWASSPNCTYSRSGTGMGGTGIIARGTGIGGTGISPEAKTNAMQFAGNVISSQGTVEAQRDGNTRRLAQGDAICVGETIVTSQSGAVQMRMADQAMVAVRPLTQLKIEKYVYGGTGKDGSQLALLKGTGRFVTGYIGKAYPQNVLIQTPTATIGVHGTDHEVTVILPNEKVGYPSGTYDKVNSGITFIRTEKGEVDIHPNQVGFAADIGELPTLLKETPDFYLTNPSMTQEGRPSREEKKDDGLGEDKKVERSLERSGEGTKLDKPVETATPSNEHPEIHHNGMELPESHALPELPQLPEHPELPGTPERPELPDQTDY